MAAGPKTSKRLAAQWDSFAMDVIGPASPAIQYEECRRAFYAGAAALFYVMNTGVSEGTGDATPDDMQLMQGLQDELEEFAKEPHELQTAKAKADRQRNLFIARSKTRPTS